LRTRKQKAPAVDSLNFEIEHLAIAAKWRKAANALSRPVPTTKITQKKGQQASIEDVDSNKDIPAFQCCFPTNPNHIPELDNKRGFNTIIPIPPMTATKQNQYRTSVGVDNNEDDISEFHQSHHHVPQELKANYRA
jgi:hypothetical protein